jgi:hypothetical protein
MHVLVKENRMLRRTLVVAAALLAALISLGGGLAQTATPFAGRETPDPALCVAAPLAGTPVAAPSVTPAPAASPNAATPAAIVEPSGQAADAATTAAVTTVIREFYACLNANAPDRAISLFTQTGASSLLAQRPDLSPSATAAGTPTPLAQQNWIALVAVTDVRVLPSGHVFAMVTQDDPNRPPDGPEPVFVIFAKQGSAWLIDEIQYLAAA